VLLDTFGLSMAGGPVLGGLWRLLNFPALSLGSWLIESGSQQPEGEVGVLSLALLLVLAQWTVVGLFLGLAYPFARRVRGIRP
jgi:hypothetical protein